MKNCLVIDNMDFISGRSTQLQLLGVLDKWTEALDEGHSIDCVYMDYAQAFDTVPHRRTTLQTIKVQNKSKSYIMD